MSQGEGMGSSGKMKKPADPKKTGAKRRPMKQQSLNDNQAARAQQSRDQQ
jgi:hypothetical protein